MSILLPVVLMLGLVGLGYAGGLVVFHLTPSDLKDLFLFQYRYWRERLRERGW